MARIVVEANQFTRKYFYPNGNQHAKVRGYAFTNDLGERRLVVEEWISREYRWVTVKSLTAGERATVGGHEFVNNVKT